MIEGAELVMKHRWRQTSRVTVVEEGLPFRGGRIPVFMDRYLYSRVQFEEQLALLWNTIGDTRRNLVPLDLL
jgi:hypothetical protein